MLEFLAGQPTHLDLASEVAAEKNEIQIREHFDDQIGAAGLEGAVGAGREAGDGIVFVARWGSMVVVVLGDCCSHCLIAAGEERACVAVGIGLVVVGVEILLVAGVGRPALEHDPVK